jgi:hypothetical protein
MAYDTFNKTSDNNFLRMIAPLDKGFAVTPHNTNDLPHVTREIWVGTAGNMVFVTDDGVELTINNIQNGTRLPYRAAKIKSTGTTATNIVGLY